MMKVTVRIAALVAAFVVTAAVTLAQAQPEPVYPAPPPGEPPPVYPAPATPPPQPPPPQPPPPGYPPPGYAPQPGYPPQPGYAPPPPYYGPPPSNGLGLIVTGSIFLGIGVINLITSPICLTINGDYNRDTRDTCLYASLGVAAAGIAIGLPLLIVGASRRRQYNNWMRGQRPMALEGLRLSLSRQGGGLFWGTAF